jgi:hypothetical protein
MVNVPWRAAASGPERILRTSAACTRRRRAAIYHSVRRHAGSRRRPDPPWPAVAAFAEKAAAFRPPPRRGSADTMGVARPFNPIDRAGHQAAFRRSHRPSPVSIAPESWAHALFSTAAIRAESSSSDAPRASENRPDIISVSHLAMGRYRHKNHFHFTIFFPAISRPILPHRACSGSERKQSCLR